MPYIWSIPRMPNNLYLVYTSCTPQMLQKKKCMQKPHRNVLRRVGAVTCSIYIYHIYSVTLPAKWEGTATVTVFTRRPPLAGVGCRATTGIGR